MPQHSGTQQERPADATVELLHIPSTASHSTTAGHSSGGLHFAGGERIGSVKPPGSAHEESAPPPPERPRLLHIWEAYEHTRAADRARGVFAVAPALEPYIGATHYSNGEPLPDDIFSAVTVSYARRSRAGKTAAVGIMMTILYVIHAMFAAAGLWLVSDIGDCGLAESSPWRRSWVVLLVLFVALFLAVIAVKVSDKDPMARIPSGFKKSAVDALFFLYCEDHCRQLRGPTQAVVHKVQLELMIHSVHGDGRVSVYELPPPPTHVYGM